MLLTLGLTYVYAPDEIARAATVLAVVLAVASAATFRADKCFALLGSAEQRRMIRLSLYCHGLLLAGLLAAFVFSAQARGQAPLLIGAAASVAASSFTSVRVGQLMAAGDAASLAWRNLAVPVLTPLGQLSAAPLGGTGAVVGGFGGMIVGALAMLRVRTSTTVGLRRESRARLREIASLAASGALTPVAVLAPTFGLLVAGFPTQAGLLTLALRIGGLPATASGPALGQAFVLKRQRQTLTRRHWFVLASAGTVWSLFLAIGLSAGAGIAFGAAWSGMVAVAVPAALISCVKVLANPSQALLLASGKSLLTLVLDVVRLAGCLLIGVTVAGADAPFEVALWSMTALLVATYAVYVFVSVKE